MALSKLLKRIRAFTLIELIIVVAIISVLGVSAFLVLTKRIGKSRDTKIISDVNTIEKAFEVSFIRNDGKYPSVSNKEIIVYSGESKIELWELGTVGVDTISELKEITKIPIDPNTKNEYPFGRLLDGTKYNIGSVIMGSESGNTSFVNKVFADDFQALVKGNYKPGIISVSGVDGVNYFFFLPSLLISKDGLNMLQNDIQLSQDNNINFIINGKKTYLDEYQKITGPSSEGVLSSFKPIFSGNNSNFEYNNLVVQNIKDLVGQDPILLNMFGVNNNNDISQQIVKNFFEGSVSMSSSIIQPTNGECGNNNGKNLIEKPIQDLCVNGIASEVVDNGIGNTFSWSCNGVNGGTNVSCTANHIQVIDGQCGLANEKSRVLQPSESELCIGGTPTEILSSTNEFTWSCNGINSSNNADCSTYKLKSPIESAHEKNIYNIVWNWSNGGGVVSKYEWTKDSINWIDLGTSLDYQENDIKCNTIYSDRKIRACDDIGNCTSLLSFTSQSTLACPYNQTLTDGFYVIHSDNTDFPSGCATSGLPNANEKCILKIIKTPSTDSFYVSPGSTNVGRSHADCAGCFVGAGSTNGQAATYCTNLKTTVPLPSGTNWYLPPNNEGGLLDMINIKSKLLGMTNQFYRTGEYCCIHDGAHSWNGRRSSTNSISIGRRQTARETRCIVK